MTDSLIGLKSRMSHTFVEATRVPVTWIKLGPCIVTHIKNEEKDGYWALQIGFGARKPKSLTKQMKGHLKSSFNKDSKKGSKFNPPLFIKEIRLKQKPDLQVGDTISIKDVFKKGDLVTVTAKSKGKGFAGVVKRWHFAGGPKTHGQSDRQRAPGSIGQRTTPGRVYKGKKMSGRMGGNTTTIKNLTIADIDEDNQMVAISGPVPGNSGDLVLIRKIGEGRLEELIEIAPKVEVQQESEESAEDKPVESANDSES